MLSKLISAKTFNPSRMSSEPLTFSAGELMIEDDPYALCIDSDLFSTICSYCIRRQANVCCSKCNWINYCNRDCKKKDKQYHDLECKVLQSCTQSEEIPDQEIRLVIRALDRCLQERRSGQISVGDYFGHKRTVDDLLNHVDHLTEEERQQAEARAAAIYNLVKDHTETSLSEVFVMLQKCRINCHSLVDHNSSQYFSRGRVVYLGVSKMNHSCEPTDYVQVFNGRKFNLRAVRDIRVDDPLSLTVHYIPPTLPVAVRQERLLNNYYFICNCTKCVWQSRHPEEVGVDDDIVNRIEHAFEQSHGYDVWYKMGRELLDELKDTPDSNFYVYWLLIQMQWTCAELKHYEESIEYGARALDGAESVLSLEPIYYSMCECMVKLGWNRRRSPQHQRFLETMKSAKDLFLLTHGPDHKITRSLDAMQKGGKWWKKYFRLRDGSTKATGSAGESMVVNKKHSADGLASAEPPMVAV